MRRLLPLFVALALPGCFSAPDACRDLASDVCNKLDSCGLFDDDFDCGRTVAELKACNRALGVSSGYDECRDGWNAVECTALQAGAQPPEVCDGAIVVPTSSAGPARFNLSGGSFGLQPSVQP